MPPRTQTEIVRHLKRSEAAAKKLHTLLMPVYVTDDFGKIHQVQLTRLPWQLGSGHWVCSAEQFRAYDCCRVQPISHRGHRGEVAA